MFTTVVQLSLMRSAYHQINNWPEGTPGRGGFFVSKQTLISAGGFIVKTNKLSLKKDRLNAISTNSNGDLFVLT
jgi:hypothetical protein